MALALKKSTLNPNAPLFVPASIREVEDFSPEWWDLITTSTWFHDYWLSQHSEEFTSVKEAIDIDISEVSDLLPDTFFLGAEDFMNLEFQFEEFIQSSESEGDISSFLASNDTSGNATGLEIDVLAQMKNLSLTNSAKEKSSRLIC